MEKLNQLGHIIAATQLIDNNLRNEAEASLERILQTEPEFFVFGFLALLKQSPAKEHRMFCAIHLRNKLAVGEPTLFESLSDQLQASVKTELIACLLNETERRTRDLIADAVVQVAESTLFQGKLLHLCCTSFLYGDSFPHPTRRRRRVRLARFDPMAVPDCVISTVTSIWSPIASTPIQR